MVPISLVVLPMYFISRLAFNRNLDLSNDVEARIAIVVASLTLACSREDFHLWMDAHAGRTKKNEPGQPGSFAHSLKSRTLFGGRTGFSVREAKTGPPSSGGWYSACAFFLPWH